jgi:hypothetical protein
MGDFNERIGTDKQTDEKKGKRGKKKRRHK